jgi:hypothetical protein
MIEIWAIAIIIILFYGVIAYTLSYKGIDIRNREFWIIMVSVFIIRVLAFVQTTLK